MATPVLAFDARSSGGADRSSGDSSTLEVVAEAGGAITALDVAESHANMLVVDVGCNASDEAHSESITKAMAALDGFSVRKVSDRIPAAPWRQDRGDTESPAEAS